MDSVYDEYKELAVFRGVLESDSEMPEQKFDRLVNENNRTGDPTCPPNVRRAKIISRSIHGRAVRMPVGIDNESEENEAQMNTIECNVQQSRRILGTRSYFRQMPIAGRRRRVTRQYESASLLNTVASVPITSRKWLAISPHVVLLALSLWCLTKCKARFLLQMNP